MNDLTVPEIEPLPDFTPRRRVSVAEAVLIILAIGYTLYFAAELLIPIAISLCLNILLSPMVRRAAKWGVPSSITAALLVSALVGFAVTVTAFLAEPAEQWVSEAPRTVRQLQDRLLPAKGRLADIQALAEEVDELTTVEAEQTAQPVVVQAPGALEDFVGGLPSMLASAGVIIFLTFFLLASGDSFLRRITKCGRTWTERRRIVAMTRHVQSHISRYLATVTIINLLLGAAVAVTLNFLQVPNPLLWGAMVTLFNFAPYVGAFVSALVLCVVGLTTFPTLAEGLAVPGIFIVMTIFEGQLLTPAILGRRMALSPTAVFLSVIIWGWMWGIAGALIAVPIVTSLKVVCDYIPELRFVGTFLRGNVATGPAASGPVIGRKLQNAG